MSSALLRCVVLSLALTQVVTAADQTLTLSRDKNWVVVSGRHLPGGEVRINYIESYCRPGSTDVDCAQTKIPHRSEQPTVFDSNQHLSLRDTLADGGLVLVIGSNSVHTVTFRLSAHNPTAVASSVHWGQPCVRLATFTGFNPDYTVGNPDDYLPRCFIFLEQNLTRMPTPVWNTTARYKPGQVWCPTNVPRTDVNPRPLNPQVPSNGLIGCFSADDKLIAATAWEPYQELFQGVGRCLHADFRIGGLAPGETKTARGVLYLVPNDVDALLKRYVSDFPEHAARR